MAGYQIKNMLVFTDFSESSNRAVRTATSIALRHNANMVLLNSVECSGFMIAPDSGIAAEQVIAKLAETNEESLKSLAAEIGHTTGLQISTKLTIGNPADKICETARLLKSDLVVMGCQNTWRIKEFFTGSNAFEVVKKAPCPVLTIPPQVATITDFRSILFPVRPVPKAVEKYGFIRKIISKNNSALRVVAMANNKPASGVELQNDQLNELQNMLDKDEVVNSFAYFTGGNFAEKLLSVAGRAHTDLIVITATLDYTMREFFTGPFAQQIVNHSVYPVLSIRPELTEIMD